MGSVVERARSRVFDILRGERDFPVSLGVALIILVALGVYADAFAGPFLFDDAPVVTRNVHIRDLSWHGFVDAAVGQIPWTRSVTNLTFWLNYHVAGTPPSRITDAASPYVGTYGPTWTYHAVNVALHALNAVLLFTLLRDLLAAGTRRKDPLAPWASGIALAATLLWAVHPVQTMAVTYITQRYALCAAASSLGTLVCYTKLRRRMEDGSAWIPTRRLGSRALVAGTILCYLLCFLTKENAIVASFIVVAVEIAFFGGAHRALPGALLALLGLAVAAGLAKFGVRFFLPPRSLAFPDRMSYFRTEWVVLLKYLRVWACPTDLTLEEDFPALAWSAGEHDFPFRLAAPGHLALALAGHSLILTLAVIWWRSERRLLAFAVAWFYLTLASESSFVPLLDPMVDHRLYLPSALLAGGLVYAAARGALALRERPPTWLRGKEARVVPALLGAWLALFLALSVGTLVRNGVYTPLGIWEDAIAKRPGCARAYASLGQELVQKEQWLEAVGPLSAAVERGNLAVEAWDNLGKAYLEIGTRIPKGPRSIKPCPPLEWGRKALLSGIAANEIAPSTATPLCWSTLGFVYVELAERVPPGDGANDAERARLDMAATDAFQRACDLAPESRVGWINLGSCFDRRTKWAKGADHKAFARKARDTLLRSGAMDPKDPLFRTCAKYLVYAQGECGCHAAALEIVLELLALTGPKWPDAGLFVAAEHAAGMADESREIDRKIETLRATPGAEADLADLAADRPRVAALLPKLPYIEERSEQRAAQLAASAPENAAKLYRNAARIALARGDQARARQDYESALRVAPAADREAWAREAALLDAGR